jgi:hypothetical protein
MGKRGAHACTADRDADMQCSVWASDTGASTGVAAEPPHRSRGAAALVPADKGRENETAAPPHASCLALFYFLLRDRLTTVSRESFEFVLGMSHSLVYVCRMDSEY